MVNLFASGGIEPVTGAEMAGRVQEALNAIFAVATPIVGMLGQLSIGVAAILLVLILVMGAGIAKRVLGVIFTIMLGIALWHLAPWIVRATQGLTNWFVQ